MNKPYFSIVIPTYNRGNLIGRCIDSIRSQNYTNWEAIIVDNYSEDNTEEIVMSYNDERIRFIKNHNYGVIAVSRNKALDMAKGDWICFLDSDDAWLPSKLEKMCEYTDKYDLIYHGFRMDLPRRYPFQRLNNYFYEINESTVEYVIQRGDPICPSCACLSRTILGQTRFDEGTEFKAVEDYDFFLQILAKHPKIKYIKKALTLYDMNGCSHNDDVLMRDMAIVNKWKNKLSDQEYKEAILMIDSRRACYFRSVGDYRNARAEYAKLFKSKIWSKKISAYINYLKSFLLQVLS